MRLFFQIMLLSQLTPQCRYPHAEQHVKLKSISRYPLVITITILASFNRRGASGPGTLFSHCNRQYRTDGYAIAVCRPAWKTYLHGTASLTANVEAAEILRGDRLHVYREA